MASAHYAGLLTDTDFDEAVAALEAIGATATGGTHATPSQRREALLIGCNGIAQAGDPQALHAEIREVAVLRDVLIYADELELSACGAARPRQFNSRPLKFGS